MKIRIPADVEMPDRILAGLTARQLAILGVHLLGLWAIWLVIGRRLPAYVFGAVAAPIGAFGLTWAFAPIEGMSLERLIAAALRHFSVPRRRVLAPEGLPALPRWLPARTPKVSALGFPAREVTRGGAIALGAEGAVILGRASSINFALRSESEQLALIDGFGRLLNALDSPVQFLVRSERVDLRSFVGWIDDKAGSLPHPALEAAAREHGKFLASLATRRDVLARSVFVSFREPGSVEDANARLERRIDDTTTLLRGLGIRFDVLDGPQAAVVLARASDSEAALPIEGEALPGELVTTTW